MIPGGAFVTTNRVVPPGTSATCEQSSHSGTGSVASSAAALLDNVLTVPEGVILKADPLAPAVRLSAGAARLNTVASLVGTRPATEGGMVSVATGIDATAVVGAIVTVAVAVTVAADGLGDGTGFPVFPTA